MPSFQISITPSRREAARFVTAVRRTILKALEQEMKKRGLKQADIARSLNVHRSVINRELRGAKDLTLGRVAELGWALDRKPFFDLLPKTKGAGSNLPTSASPVVEAKTTQGTFAADAKAVVRVSVGSG